MEATRSIWSGNSPFPFDDVCLVSELTIASSLNSLLLSKGEERNILAIYQPQSFCP